MRTPRPLKIPGQIGIAFCLHALFLNIRHPLRIQADPIEGIGLENTEGNECGESAGEQAGGNESQGDASRYVGIGNY